jgi:cytochrome c551/c552
MIAQRIAACTTLTAATLALFWLATQPSASAPVSVERKGLELQGVVSCAAANCHGGNGPRGARGSEYTTWLIHDPHARAYDVLLSDRSVLIEHNLRRRKNRKDEKPETDALCLSCHVLSDALAAPHRPRFALTDGVSCESCHGPAQKWLAPHPTWKDLDPQAKKQEYAKHSMVWMQDVAPRVEVCARCHVGTGQADVNHDLIAAGHPRLVFEYAVYQAHMPRHWDEKAEKLRYPDFEARAWAIGQVASARAALELLAARAGGPEKPWPEFAEYNCFACHQEIRAKRPERGPLPGLAPWSDWYYGVLNDSVAFQPQYGQDRLTASLGDLRRSMRRPLPEASQVARQARSCADLLKDWLDSSDKVRYGDATQLQRTRDGIQALGRGTRLDWDSDMQRYLGMAALFEAQRSLRQPAATREFQDVLRKRMQELQFPNGFDSPRQHGQD